MRTLTLIGAVLLVLAGVLLMMTPLHAQPCSGPSPAAISDARTMRFDVVSIKRDKNQTGPAIVHSAPDSDTMTLVNMSPHLMIGTAYDLLLHDQVVGLPNWADSETYDMEAKVSAETTPEFHKFLPMQRNPMLQSVLAERFHLVCHFETRALPAYALIVAKGGPKLTEVEPITLPNGLKDPGGISAERSAIAATGAPISLLLVVLQQRLGRPVVDRTGLTGRYTFKLNWAPDSASAPNAPDADQGPSIFTAVQEQLGLKLEATRAPVPVLIVDHIERPAEN
jgi:uncharacterized protein (TIGR03435 family)